MFLLALLATAMLIAQEPTPSPTLSPEDARHQETQRKLQRELEKAQLEKQIAEARRATLDALPDAKATPISANTSVNANENILTDIIVYAELERALDKIAGSVKSTVPQGSTIVIYDKTAFADWMFYKRSLPLFKVVINDLAADYCRIASSQKVKAGDIRLMGLTSSLVRSGNVVGQFADLISYFRTETTITGSSVTLTEESAVAAIFPKLAEGSGLTLLYPKSYGIDSPMFCGEATGPRPCCVPTLTDNCRETRPKYCSEVARSFDILYRSRQAAFETKTGSDDLRKLENYFKDFLSLFAEEPTQNVETVLKKYVNAEHFSAIADKENVYFLELVPLKAIGSTRVRKNLFFLSDKVDYAGGAVIQWTLLDRGGQIKNSGIESAYRGYIKPQQIRNEVP